MGVTLFEKREPMAPTETLVLRFRDLVTELGGTIKEHQATIKARGHVYWGWWNKLGEQPPIAIFTILKQKAIDSGFDLYLFDSGQNVVHKAHCIDILWQEAGAAPIPSPEPAATPAYYEGQSYSAWFKFSEIVSLPKTSWLLKDWTYVRVDELFADGPSGFTKFYGKRVVSASELAQQNRTIWFIRPAEPTDASGEILLTKTGPHEPFLQRIVDSPSANLLWISDTHFSASGHHGFPVESSTGPTLADSIEHALKDNKISLAGVMHTGDLTWEGNAPEFEQATKFLAWLKTVAAFTDHDPFVLCPGNHDVAFSADPADKKASVERASSEATEAFRKFYSKVFNSDSNEYLSSGRRYLLARAVPVEVVSLNSSLLEQKPGWFQGHGFVGEFQLRDAAEKIGWRGSDEPRAYRILILHHHLMPVTYREDPVGGQIYSVALDAEAIVRWVVEHRVDLVLHGHMHEPFCARVSRPIERGPETKEWHTFYVAGMGSTGVERAHIGASGVNTFGVLQFGKKAPHLSVYSLHPSEKSKLLWTVDLVRGINS
jgi:predicted MPP superfamily phosphohydrolase